MREFRDRVAVVTGGASGIGRALGERFAREGMKLVLADVEQGALDETVSDLRKSGAEVTGVRTDVTAYEQVENLARKTLDTYGAVHVLCNNAGVGSDETGTPMWGLALSDWQWVFSVNVWGVIHGIKAFVPLMLERGEEGHVINTSSGNGGLTLIPTTPIYSASKSVVTTLSESLHLQLTLMGAKLRASVLFPGPSIVDTNIFAAERNRPDELREKPWQGPAVTLEDIVKLARQAGRELVPTQPEQVAEHAIEGIRNDRFWILPESENLESALRDRLDGILKRRNPVPSFG